jgi:hypothetical protein
MGRQRFGANLPSEQRVADLENTLGLIGLDATEYAPLLAPWSMSPCPRIAPSRPHLGALLLGYHTDDGKLFYAGRVGTGMPVRVLADLRRRPPGTPTALHASRNQLPKLSFVIGLPRSPAMKARSPVGAASIERANSGRMGALTTTLFFSVLILG